MEFRLLGPLEVVAQERPVSLGGAKQQAVLAHLLVHANEVLPAERLIDEVWGDDPPQAAKSALQSYVSRLRAALGDRNRIEGRAPGYVLHAGASEVDALRFEALLGEGRRALPDDPARAWALLREGLALWRGPALAGLDDGLSLRPEIARLEELRLEALESRIEADLALGRHTDVVAELDVLVEEHPLREPLCAHLMLALYRSGRQADALAAYRRASRMLRGELGIDPSPALQRLERQVLRQEAALEAPREELGAVDFSVAASEVRDPPVRLRPFVGRGHELAELLGGVDEAHAGRTSLFLVAGQPGIGKSRLADEAAVRAQARGAKVLWGRCWEAGGAPAYWPWVQALRAYIRATDDARVLSELGAGAPDIAHMLPELHELHPGLPAPASLDPEGARFRLFDSTASFLRAAGEVQPLVLVLDDLHAADEPSLLLLRFVARELREARIVLVGAYRDSEAVQSDTLTEAVTELRREPITRLMRLGGLARSEVARFIELITGTQPSDRLALAIHTETEGNPLFVDELVQLLASEGRLVEAASAAWRPTVPEGVRSVIGQRSRHLSEGCKRLLSVASVLGREFRLDALERVSKRSREELLDLLDEALTARVVTDLPADRDRLRFSHALIRDSFYDDLGTKERLRLHRRTGEVLEALCRQDDEPSLAELAHHFLEASPGGDSDKAIDYARRAGDRAVALLAYEEAARLYEMALEAVERKTTPDEPTRCELLLALGDAQARAGNLFFAKETFLRAADVARTLKAPDRLARAALGYGGKFVWLRAGRDQLLIPILEDALAAQPAGDSALRARLLTRLAGALRDSPVPERRAALSREAVEMARRIGDRATLAYALDGTYAALSWPRDTQSWLAMARELTQLADEGGDKEQAYFGHLHAFGALMVRGEPRAADAELAAMAALAHELRQPARAWWLSVARGTRALFAGRIAEAEQLAKQLVDLRSGGEGLDETFDFAMTLQAWAIRREQGRLAELEGPLESFAEEYPTMFIFRCVLASLYSELGRAEEAREVLDRLAADGFADLNVGTDWFFGASLLAGVCAFLRDETSAAPLYEALLPYADKNVLSHPEVSLGSASRYVALLASTMSLRDEAARHFERALEMNARMGARLWVAHTRDDYGRMVLAGDDPGDRARALELIGEALATYRELGMDSWVEKASEHERALRAAPPPGHLRVAGGKRAANA